MGEPEDLAETGQPAQPSAGDRLRAAREAQGLSVEDIAARTRIPTRHLENIEAGNWDRMPSSTYSIGFAKSYAAALRRNGGGGVQGGGGAPPILGGGAAAGQALQAPGARKGPAVPPGRPGGGGVRGGTRRRPADRGSRTHRFRSQPPRRRPDARTA